MGKLASDPFSFSYSFRLSPNTKMFFSLLNQIVRNAILYIAYELEVDNEVVVRMELRQLFE